MADALYGRGLAQRRMGDAAGAAADIGAAKEIKPNISEDFVRYGVQ